MWPHGLRLKGTLQSQEERESKDARVIKYGEDQQSTGQLELQSNLSVLIEETQASITIFRETYKRKRPRVATPSLSQKPSDAKPDGQILRATNPVVKVPTIVGLFLP